MKEAVRIRFLPFHLDFQTKSKDKITKSNISKGHNTSLQVRKFSKKL